MGGGGPWRQFCRFPKSVLDSEYSVGYYIRMRQTVTVSIDPEVLRQFDDWRRVRALSRGDAVGALLRLAAGGGQIAEDPMGKPGETPLKAYADKWNKLAPAAGMRGEDGVAPGRVVEPVKVWEP